jgi:hypothetical protein
LWYGVVPASRQVASYDSQIEGSAEQMDVYKSQVGEAARHPPPHARARRYTHACTHKQAKQILRKLNNRSPAKLYIEAGPCVFL